MKNAHNERTRSAAVTTTSYIFHVVASQLEKHIFQCEFQVFLFKSSHKRQRYMFFKKKIAGNKPKFNLQFLFTLENCNDFVGCERKMRSLLLFWQLIHFNVVYWIRLPFKFEVLIYW